MNLSNNLPLRFLTFDILENILMNSSDPEKFCYYISFLIRDLFGVKLSLIIKSKNYTVNGNYKILAQEPHKYKNNISMEFLEKYLDDVLENNESDFIFKNIKPFEIQNHIEKIKLSLIIQFRDSNTNYGSILIFGLQEKDKINSIIEIFKTILPVFSLLLKNSFLFKEKQDVIDDTKGEYYSLANNIPVGLFKIDLNENILFYNSICEKVINMKNCSKIEDIFYNIYYKDRKEIKRKWKKLVNEKIQSFEMEIRYKKDNKKLWINILISKVISNKGHILGYVGIITDITDDKKFEKRLKKALIKSKESDRLKSEFLAKMSHELKTPINIILGFSRLVKRCKSDSKSFPMYATKIEESSLVLNSLIDNILELSRTEIENDKFELEYENVESIMNYISEIARDLIRKSKKDIHFHIKKNINKCNTIKINRNRLTKTLVNMIDNSIKFTKHGFIEFGIDQITTNSIQFYIKDTGIGIEKDKYKSIFKAFIQGDNSLTRKYEGAGLGLSLCKKNVDLMKGNIKFVSDTSEKNHGTTFIVSIPYIPKSN